MAEINYQSAGVSTVETDLTAPTAVVPTGVPAGIIGTSQKGPAFVPVTVPTGNDFIVRFGQPVNNLRNGPMAALEWLRNSQAMTFIRVLGVGNGLQRDTSSLNKGHVISGGFVAGDQQPQQVLSGALGSGPWANLGGPLGRTYFLGCFMSESAGSTFLSTAGLQNGNTSVPLVRAVIMAASGVILKLSAAVGGINSAPATTLTASEATVSGSVTGSVKLTGSKQEFVMLLNGWPAPTPSYPNAITASFDMTATNYFGNVFNKDPLKLEQAGYVLYSQWDIHPAVAAPTGSGVIVTASGSTYQSGTEKIAFLVTGSQARNSGTLTAPNFENFEDRYETAHTPWFISQGFGNIPINLFQVWSLDDGEYPNTRLKVSVENINPSTSDAYKYGTFDLLVRDFNDTDTNRSILEAWRGLSFDPGSPKFIARVIGDYYTFFNFDLGVGTQKLTTLGNFANQSKYIRVSMSADILNGVVDSTVLPMGFRGHQHLVTSGTDPLPTFSDATTLVNTNPFYLVTQPPVPFRININRGLSPRTTADKTLYWGVQFEHNINPSDPNNTTLPNKSIASFGKYYPNFSSDWQKPVVEANEGTGDTTNNGILDCDRFTKNKFTLENIQVYYNASTNIADITTVTSWSYIRTGSIGTDSVNHIRALTVNDLTDPGVRTVAKFSAFLQGGFDGVRIFDPETRYLTNFAVVQEMLNQNRGFAATGPTVNAYLTALNVMKDTSEVDIQILSMPGIRHRFLTDTAGTYVTQRFDAMLVMDIEEMDLGNNRVTGSTQDISVQYTVNDFVGRSINNSFAACYFPDVVMQDQFNNLFVRVPPTVAVLGAIARNDAVGYPWYAPAGFTRGALPTTVDTILSLTKANLDSLYSSRINPLTSFAGGSGVVVWGQKTLANVQTSLDRVNVRRLLISLRRDVKKVANRILFEQNRDTTLKRFTDLVNPILKRAQDNSGVDRFLVKIDSSTTTAADIQNKTIRGKIWIQPTKSLEFLSLNFVLTNNSSISVS